MQQGVKTVKKMCIRCQYLQALALDELLEPVYNWEEAVLVAYGEISGVQPALFVDGLLGRSLVVVVALHQLKLQAQAKHKGLH